MRTRLRSFPLLLAVLLSACAHTGGGAGTGRREPPGSPPLAGGEVLGIVDTLELAGHEHYGYQKEGILPSNVVVLWTLGRRIFTHTDALPAIGTRPVQLGDLVSFVPPAPDSNAEFSSLENLSFRNAPDSPPEARALGDFFEWVPGYLRLLPKDFVLEKPKPRTGPAGQEVVAVVAALILAGKEDFLTDGGVVQSNLVVLDLIAPAGGQNRIVATSYQLPAIGGRRVKLGDRISFVLPEPGVDDFLLLENLRFHDS
jgi:hypothetical protein